jgi:arginine exporter protein ArgO
MSSLAAGVAAGLGIAMPVGAIGTYLVGLGASAPARVSSAAAAGVASTDGIYAAVAVTAGAALETVLRPAASWLRWMSVAVLCLLALLTLLTAIRRRTADGATMGGRRPAAVTATPVRAYLVLLGLTALNPATLTYFTSLVLGRQASGTTTTLDRITFVAGAFAASLAWQLALTRGGALLGHFAQGRRGRLAIAVVSSAVMLALAAQVAWR